MHLNRTALRHRLLTEAREGRLKWYIGLHDNIVRDNGHRGTLFLVKGEKTQANLLHHHLMFVYPRGRMSTTIPLHLSELGSTTLRTWDAEHGPIELDSGESAR